MNNLELLDKIDNLYKENKIAFMTIDGLMTANINEIINQPSEGILYDLNRDEATIRTLAESSKNVRWVNDLAFVKVFKKVFNKYLEQKEIISSLEKEIDNLKDKKYESSAQDINIVKDQAEDNVIKYDKKPISTLDGYREGFDSTVVFQI